MFSIPLSDRFFRLFFCFSLFFTLSISSTYCRFNQNLSTFYTFFTATSYFTQMCNFYLESKLTGATKRICCETEKNFMWFLPLNMYVWCRKYSRFINGGLSFFQMSTKINFEMFLYFWVQLNERLKTLDYYIFTLSYVR